VALLLFLFPIIFNDMISDMKLMLTRQPVNAGFALPTVIIASVILLTMLVTSVTAVGSITSALAGQYYNQLAREAAESGLVSATACLRNSNYSPTWTDAAPLKPNTDCTGSEVGSVSKWVVNKNNARSAFSVPAPEIGAAGSLRVVSTGTVELVRTSDQNQVWRTYTYIAAQSSRYNDTPQIAGGAGFQGLGHNGYMLASNGTLYGWGDNNSYQLGDTATLGTTVTSPVKIALPTNVSKVKKVFNSGQGASILCILATDSALGDQIYCRGYGLALSSTDWTRFGLSAGLTALDMSLNGYGGDSACVKASDLQAYCAGLNDSGGLGRGTASSSYVPVSSPVKFRLDLANPGPISGSAASLTVQKVYNQDRTTCVIASDNQAYCAGDNNYGQLGQGNFTANVWIGSSTPGRALVPGNPSIAEIVLPYHGAEEGIFFRAALTDGGMVYMSGHNGYGTANDGAFSGSCANGGQPVNCYNVPHTITSNNYGKVISVSEGDQNHHAVCSINTAPVGESGLWCIGSNSFGELGAGDCVARAGYYGAAYLGGEIANYQLNAEATYQMNSVAVITTPAGNVYTAGDNTYGKLGTGGTLQACNPGFSKVQLPAGVKATAVANGDEYTMFILGDNGKVYAVGRNNNGQLGDGTTTDRKVPVEVKIPRQETVY
jgi:alpha-tubulin suppressor-like RCC1 family protein